MTLKIEISAHPDFGPLRGQVDEALEALGFVRQMQTSISGVSASTVAPVLTAVEQSIKDGTFSVRSATDEEREAVVETTKRERGKPAPGRARRTKEEIAEDEAADKADAATAGAAPLTAVMGKEFADKATEAAREHLGGQISSNPENRVGPEDEPETQEQDKADEQAEVEASRDAETPLTGEDVRSAMSLYVKKFGLPATQEDGASIFLDALGTPPKGAEGWKLSVVSEQDQPTLRKAIDAWTSAANAAERYKANG